MPTDEQIQRMLDLRLKRETMVLLRTLAIHFTEQTRLVELPKGTREWYVAEFSPMNPNAAYSGYSELHPPLVKKERVELIYFFGMYVGYYQPSDVLFYWRPE